MGSATSLGLGVGPSLQLPTGGHYPHIVDARPLVDAMRAWLAD